MTVAGVVRKRVAVPIDLSAPRKPGVHLAAIVLAALLARGVTYGNPVLHADESYYFVVAHAWAHGSIPYLDVWDRKPIGLFLLYLPAALFGYPAGIWAYQLLALASMVATAWLIRALAIRAGWAGGALAAALLYVLWADLLEGQGGQAPIFYNLPVAIAAALIAPAPGRSVSRPRGVAAMLLIGCALQIKYSVVFEGAFFGLWLLAARWRLGDRLGLIGYAAALSAVAALPSLLAWGAYRAIGGGEAWVFANLTSILARRHDPLLEQASNLAILLLLASPVIAAGVLGFARRTSGLQRWLAAWALAAALGVLAFGTWFDHYALPLLVPLCIGAAGFFADHPNGRRIAVPMLIVAFAAGQAMLAGKRSARGTPAEFAALSRVVGHGAGCLYVYSGEPMLYAATGRCAATRYRFPSHLTRSREDGATGVVQREEIARILAQRPAIIVLKPLYRGERPALHAFVAAEVQAHYALAATVPLGTQRVSVYRRR